MLSTRTFIQPCVMLCPACKIPLKEIERSGQWVDRCPNCFGTWFDENELSAVLEHASNSNHSASDVPAPSSMTCPKCDDHIEATVYSYDSSITINRCNSCKGVWLENGQLQQIANYRKGDQKTERLANALVENFKADKPFERASEWLRSRVLSTIVASFLLLIAFTFGGDIVQVAIFLVLPMACIWFPDVVGNLTGISFGIARPIITQKTPAIAVALGGWFLLFTVFALMMFTIYHR